MTIRSRIAANDPSKSGRSADEGGAPKSRCDCQPDNLRRGSPLRTRVRRAEHRVRKTTFDMK